MAHETCVTKAVVAPRCEAEPRPKSKQKKPKNKTPIITDSPAALQFIRISGSVGRAFPLPVVDGAGDEVTQASAPSGSAGRETGQRGQPGALPPPRGAFVPPPCDRESPPLLHHPGRGSARPVLQAVSLRSAADGIYIQLRRYIR